MNRSRFFQLGLQLFHGADLEGLLLLRVQLDAAEGQPAVFRVADLRLSGIEDGVVELRVGDADGQLIGLFIEGDIAPGEPGQVDGVLARAVDGQGLLLVEYPRLKSPVSVMVVLT